MMDETASVAGVCVIAAILAVLLKQYCREHAMFCVIAACVTIGLAAMVSLTPIAELIRGDRPAGGISFHTVESAGNLLSDRHCIRPVYGLRRVGAGAYS